QKLTYYQTQIIRFHFIGKRIQQQERDLQLKVGAQVGLMFILQILKLSQLTGYYMKQLLVLEQIIHI
ncbi:MAG: hypothetical protein WCL54_05360, partial [Clostridia bacterium]